LANILQMAKHKKELAKNFTV